MNKYLLLIFFTALLSNVSATVPDTPRCSLPEFHQFDFWVGEWDVTWNDTVKGTNNITKGLGNCVIQENFSDPSNNFFGKSFSVYNPDKKQWEQTWVDNEGSYMAFTGEFKDGRMILSRSFTNKKGKQVIQRMVFFNIKLGSLDWSWESSSDDGKTWKQNWLIHYKRK